MLHWDSSFHHHPHRTTVAMTYYDSWEMQMEDMDDGRKEALRRQHNVMSDSVADDDADIQNN